MAHKRTPLILLLIIFIVLAIAPVQAQAPTDWVGVRIPSGDTVTIASTQNNEAAWVHDYGAFVWVVTNTQSISPRNVLSADAITYAQPFHITLGGETFDPLTLPPDISITGEGRTGFDEPGLFLVQCYGPSLPAWLEALTAAGLDVIQYIYPFTYLVWGTPSALESASRLDFVRHTWAYQPAYAVLPQNRILSSELILARAMVVPQAGLEHILAGVEKLGGQVLGIAENIDPSFTHLTLSLPGDAFSAMAYLPGVVTVQPVPLDGGTRGEMSAQISAGNIGWNNRVYPGYQNWLNMLGLSGQEVIIANVDEGIDQTHPDLVNRMLPCEGSTCGGTASSKHGTHTAGIMAGDGTSGVRDAYGFLRGLGVAPGASLIDQNFRLTSAYPDGLRNLMAESSRNNAVISGNSWGVSETAQGYDIDTRLVDIGVRDADPDKAGSQPLTYVLSIMNGYGDTSTQGTPDEAKNIFTIGSTVMQYSNGAQNLNINDLSTNTAHGPALDGRTIPHLVAPGCYVESTMYSSSYGLMCGTSMASPHVSGGAALFFERYRKLFGDDPSPAMVKAAFLPVAHSLAGHLDANGNTLGQPFDSKQGWGRLNLKGVLQPGRNVYYFDEPEVFTSSGQTWTADVTSPTTIREMRAMLVWTDAPGAPLGGSTPAWVNDLDLSITFEDNTFYGNNFGGDGFSTPGGTPDGRNNTEGIFLQNLDAGTYTFTVTAASLNGVDDSPPSQDFALVIYLLEEPEEPEEPEVPIYQYLFPLFCR